MVRILIVEDQKIMQKYFEYIIMQEPEFRHVQTVADAREAVKICDYLELFQTSFYMEGLADKSVIS